MIFALFLIASVVTVLHLASRLHETRHQLDQARRQRDSYERQMFESLVVARIVTGRSQREPES